MDDLYPVSIRQSVAVIGRLGNDIEIDLDRHPITLELQMLQEPGDRTAQSDVDCLAIKCNVHVFSFSALYGYFGEPTAHGAKTQKAAEAARNIGMFALPYAGITRIRY